MESIYLGIVLFLFLLAIFDLVVGVSNDAVNFLGSAVGARAASFKWIMGVAAVGILCGAVMSNGMMDVARHGIFRPEQFYFQDIMCICLAVMAIDVILLDTFNTLGLPTSTTVSIVFELLGGAFALAMAAWPQTIRGLPCRYAEFGKGFVGHHGHLPFGGDRIRIRRSGAIYRPIDLYFQL